MDYKAMISARRREAINLRENRGQYTLATEFEEDANAIETLLAERDAAIADIERDCKTCIHYKSNTRGHIPCDVMDICIFSDHWQWCGPQKYD